MKPSLLAFLVILSVNTFGQTYKLKSVPIQEPITIPKHYSIIIMDTTGRIVFEKEKGKEPIINSSYQELFELMLRYNGQFHHAPDKGKKWVYNKHEYTWEQKPIKL